jgi:L-threonylcarbamoyladenylate synthase
LGGGAVEQFNTIVDTVCSLYGEVLGLSSVGRDADFFADLNGNSLGAAEVIVAIEEVFGVPVLDAFFADSTSVSVAHEIEEGLRRQGDGSANQTSPRAPSDSAAAARPSRPGESPSEIEVAAPTGRPASTAARRELAMNAIFAGGSPAAIDAAVAALSEGGVAILPADTVYNFFGRADVRSSTERVYRIKLRDRRKPFIIYTNRENVSRWAEVTPIAQELIDAFWPRAVSLVLRKSEAIPDWFTDDSRTVAVMTASNPIVTKVIEGVRGPLFGTTVNESGEPSSTTWVEARRFGPLVDVFIADDMALVYRAASTMVDCTVSPPTILREEAIPVDAIRAVLPQAVVDVRRRK